MKTHHIAQATSQDHAIAAALGKSIPLHPDHPLRRELGGGSEKTVAARIQAYEVLVENHGHETALAAARTIVNVS